jgi:hypothetical protein
MLEIAPVDAREYSSLAQLGKLAAGHLREGRVVDMNLVTPDEARMLVDELSGLLDSHFQPGVRSYGQLLFTGRRCVFNWGSLGEEHAVLLDIDAYPLTRMLARTIAAVSDEMRTGDEHLVLSLVPALRRRSTYPRFFHRESHQSLDQLVNEGTSPSIYRLTCDLGLENSFEVLNVNLVPRKALLGADGQILLKYRHLFQQQAMRISARSHEEISSPQSEVTEETLPFPETAHDLKPGHALLWLDDLFFHAPYLRAGRSLDELKTRPRSIVIVNEFCNNSYQRLKWPAAVARLLSDIL